MQGYFSRRGSFLTERRAAVRYGVAVLLVATAVMVELRLETLLDPETLLLGALLIAAWFGGLRPALLGWVLATLAFVYYFTPPQYSFAIDLNQVPPVVVFMLLGLAVAVITAARREAEDDLKRTLDEIEARVRERTAELERSNEQLQAGMIERQRVEEALRERANLLDLTHDTVMVRNVGNVITLWNRGAEDRYGWTRHEAIGRVSHELLQTVFPRALVEIDEMLNRTGRWEGELVHTRRDGTQITVASRWAMQFDAQGNPIGILETNNDITERKRAESALRASERRHRHIFQAVGVSIWDEDFSSVKAAIDALKEAGVRDFRQYLDTHPDFVRQAIAMVRVVDVNEATLRLFGAQSKADVIVSLDRIFTAETHDVFAGELIAIAEGRTSFESETVLRTLQGDEIAALFTITFPPPPSGFETVLVSITDITERKRAEERLQQQANLLAQTHDAVIVWEFPTNIVYWNKGAERLYGFTREEALGRLTHDLLQTQHPMPTADFEAMLVRKGEWTGELGQTTRAGRKIIVDSRQLVTHTAERGRLVLETNRDVTERKRAEEALEDLAGRLIRAQEEERSRIGRELHDHISQMLGVLTIKIDQLQMDPAVTPAVNNALDGIRNSTSEVTDEVRHLSHRLHSSMLDYLGLVPALRKLVGEFSERHGIPIEFVPDSLPTPLPSEIALALFRVTEESLTNIAKHSQARSARVHVKDAPDGIRLSIDDDGIGFDVTSHTGKGGLGLVSMQERLRALRGTVRIDSARSGGTRIDVWVPSMMSTTAHGEKTHRSETT
jgi:PAS domain S-box-containing protein